MKVINKLDEVKKKKKIEFWLNIYPSGSICSHTTKDMANELANTSRICCIYFNREYEDGEGL